MKRAGVNWLWTSLVLLVAAYTFWDYRKLVESGADPESQEIRLFQFQNEQVTRVRISNAEESIEIRKVGESWQMIKPLEDQVDSASLEAFLYSLGSQKGKLFAEGEKASPDWTTFGLAPPASTVEVETARGVESLQISSKNAFDGSFYVRQEDRLLLGDRGLAQIAGRSAASFRSRQIWRDEKVVVLSADAQIDTEDVRAKFHIAQRGKEWVLDPAPPFAVDAERVANWLVRIQQFAALEVVVDSPTQEDLRRYLMLKPSAVITFHVQEPNGKKRDWVLRVGQDRAEDLFLQSSDRDALFRSPRTDLNLVRVPLEFFREGRQAFRFPVERAHKIELKLEGKSYSVIKEGMQWKVDGKHSSDEEIVPDKVIGTMQNLARLEAQEYLPMSRFDRVEFGNSMTVKDAEDKPLLHLEWGKSFPSGQSYNKGMTFAPVRTNLEKEGMLVQTSTMQSLIEPGLIIKKTPKK